MAFPALELDFCSLLAEVLDLVGVGMVDVLMLIRCNAPASIGGEVGMVVCVVAGELDEDVAVGDGDGDVGESVLELGDAGFGCEG